ncbi:MULTISPECIES: hypothetical protein [Methylobacter]
MAIEKKTTDKTKVLVNVYEPVIAIMKHKLDEACLKRDAYLDKALCREAGFLREEVVTPNSDKAKSYIADNLKQLKLKPLNLLLSTETVELMNVVCKEKNIPRDAFINRVFLLLIASDTVIDVLFFSLFKECLGTIDPDFWVSDWNEWEIVLEPHIKMYHCFNRPNILDSIEEFVNISPFWRLRDYFSGYEADWKMYSYPFEKKALNNLPDDYTFLKTDNILGFNTFMTDDEVSKQEALDKTISAKIDLDKLLAFAKKEKQVRPVKVKLIGDTQ